MTQIAPSLHNKNIESAHTLDAPSIIKSIVPITEEAANTVATGREDITKILQRQDDRFIVITGPCSIHDPAMAMDYAKRLLELKAKVEDKILIIMRVYFEKPRTTVGWKGLVNDPHLNDSFDLRHGLELGRKILLDINAMGLPAAVEFLDPVVPQYLSDLVSWTAIGARTTESQTHREMSSGLSMPVGFKNGTDGGTANALNAIESALSPHHFLGINQEGQTCVLRTKGNKEGILVLRGGNSGPNFDTESVNAACADMSKRGLTPQIIVDCSHANSNKDHNRQPAVLEDIVAQFAGGNKDLIGCMLESNINAGNQSISDDMAYGVSVTDKCIDWETTEKIILDTYKKLS